MRYWVIKGNRRENDPFEDWFKQGHVMTWRTAKPPKSWQTGDRLFFWKSSPDRLLVGLGILKEIYDGRDEYGDANFDVEYLTSLLENQPTIVELRNDPRINTASFLKAGVAGTVYPLSQEYGENLFRIVVEKNSSLRTIWKDINLGDPDQFFDDIDQDEREYSGTEGGKRLVTHLQTERDRTLIERKKRQVLAKTGRLECEICGFDFAKFYGDIGYGFCEAHHIKPLGRAEASVETKLADLALICSNCHRMIHRTNPMETITEFKERLRS